MSKSVFLWRHPFETFICPGFARSFPDPKFCHGAQSDSQGQSRPVYAACCDPYVPVCTCDHNIYNVWQLFRKTYPDRYWISCGQNLHMQCSKFYMVLAQF